MTTASRPLGLGKYLVGLAGTAGGALTGVWLMTAPFALSYQPDGAGWADATRVGVFTGLAALLVSLTGAALLAADAVGALRSAGVLARKPSRAGRRRAVLEGQRRAAEEAPPAAGNHHGTDVDLHQLAALLLQELQQPTPQPSQANPQPSQATPPPPVRPVFDEQPAQDDRLAHQHPAGQHAPGENTTRSRSDVQ